MEMLSALCYWPLRKGIHHSLVDSPHKEPVTQNFDVNLWCQPEQAVEQTVKLPVIWDTPQSCDVISIHPAWPAVYVLNLAPSGRHMRLLIDRWQWPTGTKGQMGIPWNDGPRDPAIKYHNCQECSCHKIWQKVGFFINVSFNFYSILS